MSLLFIALILLLLFIIWLVNVKVPMQNVYRWILTGVLVFIIVYLLLAKTGVLGSLNTRVG